jgi:hypothetical protein
MRGWGERWTEPSHTLDHETAAAQTGLGLSMDRVLDLPQNLAQSSSIDAPENSGYQTA